MYFYAEIRANLGLSNVVLTDTAQTISGAKIFSAEVFQLTGTAGPQKLKIGRVDGTGSAPHIDFNSGATVTDRDARIQATGGNGSNNGGTLNLLAANVLVNGAIIATTNTAQEIPGTKTFTGGLYLRTTGTSSVFEIGAMDGTARTAAIDFHSSGGAEDYNVRISSIGGTQGTAGGGACNITAGTLTFNNIAILKTGDHGLGGLTEATANFENIANSGKGQWFKSPASGTGYPDTQVAWCGLHLPYDTNAASSLAILAATSIAGVRMSVHARRGGVNNGWFNVLLSNQYTIDANGFYKSASPIMRLANSAENMPGDFLDGFTIAGVGAFNEEAVGVTAERLDTGVYLISGALGLAESGWIIEIPQDVNGNRLCFVETETADNGDITVRVSKRRFEVETGNIVAGELMDIPSGRWIDLRLSMSTVPEPDYSDIDDSGSSEPGI